MAQDEDVSSTLGEGHCPKRTELSPRQELCMLLLMSGMSQASAARALKVHATTVWRWMRPGTVFRSIYHQRIREFWVEHRRETARIMLTVMNASLEQVNQEDFSSVERGTALLAKATKMFPPKFLYF